MYNSENQSCYELRVLKKLCMKVGLKFFDNLPASEAELVSSVGVTQGCFLDGAVGLYKTLPLEQVKNGEYEVDFKDIPVEVRDELDPYTVFTSIDPA